MSLDVRVRKEAERDIEQAAQWYERQRAGLGQLFLNEVQRALAVLGEEPSMYPFVHRETRRLLIRKFPFGIYYRTYRETAVVVAVMHGSRHPRRWQKRE